MYWIYVPVLLLSLLLFAVMIGHLLSKRDATAWLRNGYFESDEEFLNNCEIPPTNNAKSIALAVRCSVADIVAVPQTSLKARCMVAAELADQFKFDFVDWIDVKFRVQRMARVQISEKHWFNHPSVRALPPSEVEFRHYIQAAVAVAAPQSEK